MPKKPLFILFLLVIALTPTALFAQAAGRRRPITRSEVTLTGRILDATDASPVFEAIVRVGGRSTTARSDGTFTLPGLNIGDATVEVERWGYNSGSQRVTLVRGSNNVEVRVTPKPVITLTDSSGGVHRLDFETANFSVAGPLAGYTPLIPAEFCRPDGTLVSFEKSQIARITGPGVPVTNASCCREGGEGVQVRLTLKNGESFDAIIRECTYYRYDFVGRNRTTGIWEYLSFRQISEVVFP